MHQRWLALGKRLMGVTKEELDDASDYFVLQDEPLRVVLVVNGNNDKDEKVVNTGHKLAGEGWYIKNPHSYTEAVICHEGEGVEQNLAKRAER